MQLSVYFHPPPHVPAWRSKRSPGINGTAFASPGYFTVTLNTSIKAETTVTNHTALWRFTFPAVPVSQNGGNVSAPLSPLILVDLRDLPSSRSYGQISVHPETGRITGNGTFEPSFGIGTYNLSFCADFSGANIRNTGVFKNNRAGSQPKSLQVVSRPTPRTTQS